VIFIDRSIPKGVADALKCVREDIIWLEDRFNHRAKEIEWMPVVGSSDWLAVLRDKKIRTRPLERQSIFRHGLGCFIFTQNNNPSRWDYFKLFAKTLDEMEQRYADTAKPFIYLVDRDGRIRLDEAFAGMVRNGRIS